MHIVLKIPHIFLLILLLCITASCVSDVDFDRGDEIVLTQEVDLDLIFFTLTTEDFEGANENAEMAIVRDTTRLEFLDDDFSQENIKNIEFTFRVENTFGQSLINSSKFLNDAGVLQYELIFDIAPSTDGQPVVTTIIENLTESEIEAVVNSIQVVSETIVQTNNVPIAGEVNLRSKALYSLEFRDL